MTAKFNYAAHQIAFCPLMKEYAYVPKPPQTPAQRKAAERQRHKDAGRTEVRGIYAPQALHAKIKASAAKVVSSALRAARVEVRAWED